MILEYRLQDGTQLIISGDDVEHIVASCKKLLEERRARLEADEDCAHRLNDWLTKAVNHG